MTGERRNDLLVRLLDALERYYQHVSDDDELGQRVFADVSAWFESTDTIDRHAFERICRALDLDPTQIRRSLERRRAEIRSGRVPPPRR
jgi:hypothetical protein